MTRFYAGIGARKTPRSICERMTNVAEYLEIDEHFMLRSGGAQGADAAFFVGVKYEDNCQIFIPWDRFQGFSGTHPSVCALDHMDQSWVTKAYEIAQAHHPAWDKLSPAGEKMMVRNTFQVLGHDLETPSEFVICWTPNGNGGGGTGQAIRIANSRGIPVIDLGAMTEDEAEQRILSLL